MVPPLAPLLAVMAVLFCLGYFAMASLPFIFVKLDIPEVWRLFRGLFALYFLVLGPIGLIAALVFAISGGLAFAGLMLAVGATAAAARRRVMVLMDSQQDAGRTGDLAAMRQLRRTHWAVMLANIAVIASVVVSLPRLF